jgi:hypothetical protein
VYGTDPATHRVLAASYPSWRNGTVQDLLGYDSNTRHQVFDQPLDAASQYNIIAARVDAQRHRIDLLAWRGGDNADVVLSDDPSTGTLSPPVPADNGTPSGHFYTMLDVQQATGKVDLAGALTNDFCLLRPAGFTTVDLESGTTAPMTPAHRCLTGLASDQAGHAELTVGPIYSDPLYPQAQLQQVDENAGTKGPLQDLGARSPLFPVADRAHGLLIVGSLVGNDYLVNNNGMSGVGVYDLRTGAQLSYRADFDLFSVFGLPAGTFGTLHGEQGIQLDPATRTGWTYSPYGNQLQQFSYLGNPRSTVPRPTAAGRTAAKHLGGGQASRPGSRPARFDCEEGSRSRSNCLRGRTDRPSAR